MIERLGDVDVDESRTGDDDAADGEHVSPMDLATCKSMKRFFDIHIKSGAIDKELADKVAEIEKSGYGSNKRNRLRKVVSEAVAKGENGQWTLTIQTPFFKEWRSHVMDRYGDNNAKAETYTYAKKAAGGQLWPTIYKPSVLYMHVPYTFCTPSSLQHIFKTAPIYGLHLLQNKNFVSHNRVNISFQP